MRFFCLCQAADVVNLGNDDNYIGLRTISNEKTIGQALPEYPMEVKQIGVKQFIVDSGCKRILYPAQVAGEVGLSVRQHHPNVDIIECKKCGARIARQ